VADSQAENFIHCYILDTNDVFDPGHPASKDNLPYVLPLNDTQVIASPVRLGATIDMTIGSHGTIIYIDNHTNNYQGQGQRLAGNQMDEATEDEGLVLHTRESAEYYSIEQDEWTKIGLQEEEGTIAIGYMDGRIMIFDYA